MKKEGVEVGSLSQPQGEKLAWIIKQSEETDHSSLGLRYELGLWGFVLVSRRSPATTPQEIS